MMGLLAEHILPLVALACYVLASVFAFRILSAGKMPLSEASILGTSPTQAAVKSFGDLSRYLRNCLILGLVCQLCFFSLSPDLLHLAGLPQVLTLLSLFVLATVLFFGRSYRLLGLEIVLAPVVLFLSLLAGVLYHLFDYLRPEMEVLPGTAAAYLELKTVHVGLILIALALLLLSFVLSLAYLLVSKLLRDKTSPLVMKTLPALRPLDAANRLVFTIGVTLFLASILLISGPLLFGAAQLPAGAMILHCGVSAIYAWALSQLLRGRTGGARLASLSVIAFLILSLASIMGGWHSQYLHL